MDEINMLKKYILHICVRFDVFVLSICYRNPVLGTLFFTYVLGFLAWAQNTFIVSFDRETHAFFTTEKKFLQTCLQEISYNPHVRMTCVI
jgi:hypothetical protein